MFLQRQTGRPSTITQLRLLHWTCWSRQVEESRLQCLLMPGVIIFVNSAPIIWYWKKQNTVESSSFGSEFNALRVAMEQVISLMYKLRMFGIPVIGAVSIFCDNEAVQKSNSDPFINLNRKHNSVRFYLTRKEVAAGLDRLGWMWGTENPSDIFPKIIDRVNRAKFARMLTLNSVGSINPENA